MHRLAGYAEGVADLLPRPSGPPGLGDVDRLNALGEPVQRSHGPQSRRGISGTQLLQVQQFHVCQSELTGTLVSSQTDKRDF